MQSEMRERLVDLIVSADISLFGSDKPYAEVYADYLIENGAILPPCKIGDVVYIRNKSRHIPQGGISSYQITNLTITQNKKGVWTKKYRAMYLLDEKTIDIQLNFEFDDIGKTVFLTREEAEQKLKENENNGYYGKAGGVA